MSRRQTRLYGDLALLSSALESMEIEPELRSQRDEALSTLSNYLLPRLKEPPPLLVALIGSTGAGKSTLVNSLAGEVISMPGPLRPTTKRTRIWARKEAAGKLAQLGPVSVGNHPLLDRLALADTPDLDSDVIEHRTEALAVSQAADLIVFVTTAARYGDQLVWRTLTSLSQKRPLAIVLNRVPSRSTGARNDLLARLRAAGLGHLPVFAISEQRIDSLRRRLSPQSVQRLAAFLRELGPGIRQEAMNRAADRVAALVGPLRTALAATHQQRTEERQALEKAAVELADLTRAVRTPRWRIRRAPDRTDLTGRIGERVRQALGNGSLAPASEEILRAGPPYSTAAERVIAIELALRPPADADTLEALERGWRALLDASFEGS